MIVLQIEHPVPNFEGWKKAFESDPIDRKKSGVKSYRIYRLVKDPGYVIIDLVFDNVAAAESTLVALRKLWVNVQGVVMENAQVRILEIVEHREIL